jgi:hypothetical protein
MFASRLFHTVVIIGAALVAGPMMACSGDDGSPSTGSGTTPSTDAKATTPDPAGDAGPDAQPNADAGVDPGWPPTK